MLDKIYNKWIYFCAWVLLSILLISAVIYRFPSSESTILFWSWITITIIYIVFLFVVAHIRNRGDKI